jgi:ankyrin repeat protein
MSPEEQLVDAVRNNDLDAATRLLGTHPQLAAKLNDPLPGLPFDATILQPAVRLQNREMIALLQLAGADINTKTHWWAGGFSVLDFAEPDFVPFLLERGAVMTAHAAARLGKLDELERLVRADPSIVNAPGGDGQRPLHVAKNVEVAKFLLDHGAEIDALDVDHESTAAQYAIRERQDVSRFLVERGARSDILMAAALGDVQLVQRHLDADRSNVYVTVSDKYFPKKNPRSGGTIYIWALGGNKSAHIVARDFGHDDVFDLLMRASPKSLQFVVACQVGDRATVNSLRAADSQIVKSLTDDERRQLVHAAESNNADAVALMLENDWPMDVHNRGQTPLHWAAFHGNAAMTRDLLARKAPLEKKDDENDGTPLQWALYGSLHGWHRDRGDYVGTVTALLDAGAKLPGEEVHASDEVLSLLKDR